MAVADHWGKADMYSLIKLIKDIAVRKHEVMINVVNFLSIGLKEPQCTSSLPPPPPALLAGLGLKLDHHIFDKERGWVKGQPEAHPTVRVSVEVDKESYNTLGLTEPLVETAAVDTLALADSGAQMTAAGLELLHALGATRRDLVPVTTTIAAANHSDMGLLGALIVKIKAESNTGEHAETKQICYICSTISTLFLSQAALKSLNIVTKNFLVPKITESEINSSTYLANEYRSKEQEKEQEARRKRSRDVQKNAPAPRGSPFLLPPPSCPSLSRTQRTTDTDSKLTSVVFTPARPSNNVSHNCCP